MKISKITLLVLLILVIIAEVASAVSTTKQEAEKAVIGWLKFDTQPLKMKLGQQIKETEIFSDANDQPIYYVVYLQPSGFVIVPADDLIEPIIAFADDGVFVPSLNNPLGALVNQDINGRIRAARSLSIPQPSGNKTITLEMEIAALEKAASVNQSKWGRFISISEMVESGPMEMGLPSISDVRVDPLVHSRWNQGSVCGDHCYNYYTPNHYPCGCVATAMAQYMRFQEYAVGPYIWSNMVLIPDCSITTTERQAIGELCSDAGVSVNMNYGSGGSSADTLRTKDALTSTFGYSNAIKGWNSGSDIGGSLIAMVNPNLDYGNPVILGITGTSGGHAIVTDGYGYNSSTLYHHLNMGWSGSDDAWYNLPDIDSSPSFNSVYKCVYNIFINGTGEIISGRVVDTSGNPINGAMVTATRNGGGTYNTTTNSNGIYAFGKIPANSSYTVSVSKDGLSFTIQNANTGLSSDYSSASGNTHGVNFVGSSSGQNHNPILYNPRVLPLSGTTLDDFEYLIDYYDSDGDAPAEGGTYIWVRIDGGERQTMPLKSGASANGTYHLPNISLDTGTHSYSFSAVDTGGGVAVTDTFNGPYVDVPTPGSFDIIGFTLDDSPSICYRNNGDGDFQSSEQIHIRPHIQYNGILPATYIDVKILYEGTELELTQGDRRYPDLGDGDSAYPENNGYFWVHSVDYGFTGTINLDIQIDWEESGAPVVIEDAIQLMVEPTPVLRVTPVTWDFGVASPGDYITHTMNVHNQGSGLMTVTDVQTSNADTSVSPTDKSFTLTPGSSRNILITIDTGSISNGTTISREVQVVSDAPLQEESPPSDRTIITGLVSDSTAVFQVPGVTTCWEPDISDAWIVWDEDRYGNWDIFAYNIGTDTEIQVTNDSARQSTPRISGNLIVWEDLRNGGTYQRDIYGYDIGTGQEFIISNDPAHERLIGVDNGKVAFGRIYHEITEPSEGDTKLYNLWLYDRGTQLSTNVTGFTSNTSHNPMHTIWAGDADFGDDLLVWHERTMQWTTHIYDHWEITDAHADKMQIGVDSSGVRALEYADEPYPRAASGTRFVWLNDDDKVSLWDQGAKQQITSEDGDDDAMAIGDRFIVYRKRFQQEVFYWDISESQELLLTDQVYDAEAIRMDGDSVVWWGRDPNSQWHVYYAFLHQSDISLASANLTFSDDAPHEGSTIDVNCIVRNLTDYDLNDDITVCLYDGDPESGTQLGSDVIISGGIAAKDYVTVNFSNIPVSIEGTHEIYVRIYVPGFDNPANNTATKTLVVQDSDTEGPVISNVIVQEYNGNGDGRIEDNEQVLVSWQATDISGINSSWCTIDSNDYPASGTYYVILEPCAVGNYNFVIFATDGDISPETSQSSDSFMVSFHGDINEDGEVNLEDINTMANQWLQPPGTPSADIAPSPVDGFVNFLDFAILAKDWLGVAP